jgi:hypothetical protein
MLKKDTVIQEVYSVDKSYEFVILDINQNKNSVINPNLKKYLNTDISE